jgi:Rrf2 family iron-sulfur cluster assembly transcriptional regulator
MKLSTKGRYAVRAMLDLALHYQDGLVLIKDIARRQAISERYLEHLFVSLKTEGVSQECTWCARWFHLGQGS